MIEPSIEHLGCGQMITKIGFMHYWITWQYKFGADRHAFLLNYSQHIR